MKSTHLAEKAEYSKFSKVFDKDLFDKIVSLDKTKEKRYEVWLLTIFKKQLSIDIDIKVSTSSNLPKELVRFYKAMVFLDQEVRERGITLELVKQAGFSLQEPISNEIITFIQYTSKGLSSFSGLYNGLDQPEQRGRISQALNIHRWLLLTDKLPDPTLKNIARVPNLLTLFSLTTPFIDEYEEATLASKVQVGRDYDILMNTTDGGGNRTLLIKIKTHEGSSFWGRGTTWCIVPNKTHFQNYTNNQTSPCIFYITVTSDGYKHKLAFVEGTEPQYRDSDNNELTVDDLYDLPNKHIDILKKHLWMFKFIAGELSVHLTLKAIYPDEASTLLSELIDLENLMSKDPIYLSKAEKELVEYIRELAYNDFTDSYESQVDDEDIPYILGEEPDGGEDANGNKLWSDEQRERAVLSQTDSDYEVHLQYYIDTTKDTPLAELGRDLEWHVSNLVTIPNSTINDVDGDTYAETIASILVEEHGTKSIQETYPRAKNLMLENLLREFKYTN
jgi:hypothetical protein